MTNHWPIVAAIFFISCAVALGLLDHEEALNAVNNATASVSTEKQPAPYQATTPAATPDAPAAGAPAPSLVRTPVREAAPADEPTAPGAILQKLKRVLQEKTNVTPLEQANGGYSFNMAGARLDEQPAPGWAIKLYNIPQTPGVDTADFKLCLDTVTNTFGLDLSKAAPVGNGGRSLSAQCKMGQTNYIRDPNGGACTFSPARLRVPVKVPAPAPHNPATPVAPPKPPDITF